MAPIPSAVYPYAAKFWPAQAQTSLIWLTANREGNENILFKIINVKYIAAGGLLSLLSYGAIAAAGLPIVLFYGLIAGTTALPGFAIQMFIGGMLGRYYFEKRYGKENWSAYAPVVVAGYYCGMGLIGMAAVALALLSKSVSRLPY